MALFTEDLCTWGREAEDVDAGDERRGEKQKKKVKEALEETTGPVGKEGSLLWQPWLWGKGKRSESQRLAEAHPEEDPLLPSCSSGSYSPPTHLMFTEHLPGDGLCDPCPIEETDL